MTTLIGWYDKQGEMDASYLIADGRISAPQDSEVHLYCDNFPKVIPIDVQHFNETASGCEQGKSFSIGVAFCGSTLAASATIETFRQVCSTLSGPLNSSPSLLQLANLLGEIHWHHRRNAAMPDSLRCEFLLTGYCLVDKQLQIIQLCENAVTQKLDAQIAPMNGEPIIIGSEKQEIKEAIDKNLLEIKEPVAQRMVLMGTLYKICSKGGINHTGGTFSLGYFNPYWKIFRVNFICDYELDAAGALQAKNTLNGFDLSEVKKIIPRFYSSAFGFSPFLFSDRISELKKQHKVS